jgi:hypothetical protein
MNAQAIRIFRQNNIATMKFNRARWPHQNVVPIL